MTDRTITLGDLLLMLSLLAGGLIIAFGMFATFAGGMSDNNEVGADACRKGCFFIALGFVMFAASAWGLVSS